jgi:hypothetical protein
MGAFGAAAFMSSEFVEAEIVEADRSKPRSLNARRFRAYNPMMGIVSPALADRGPILRLSN